MFSACVSCRFDTGSRVEASRTIVRDFINRVPNARRARRHVTRISPTRIGFCPRFASSSASRFSAIHTARSILRAVEQRRLSNSLRIAQSIVTIRSIFEIELVVNRAAIEMDIGGATFK